MIIFLFLISQICMGQVKTPLVNDKMTEAQRYKILSQYFYPPPGKEVEVDVDEVRNQKYKKDPLLYRGYITVSPPKGICITVTRDPDIDDDIICSKKRLSFAIKHLDRNGSFQWIIKTGPGDFGNRYRWYTPHRIAQAIHMGARETVNIPIQKCIPRRGAETRQIILKMINGENWVISFPDEDRLLKEGRTNIAQYLPTMSGYMPRVVEVKKDDPVTKHWVIPEEGSYGMNASNFKTMDSAPGMKGSCRYRFEGAPDDRQSGWIECHETDQYDVIYSILPCAHEMLPGR